MASFCTSLQDALELYKDDMYVDFNKFLRDESYAVARKKDYTQLVECIGYIDDAMKTKEEWGHTEPMIVYRGMHKNVNMRIYDEFAYSSTSTDISIAAQFSNDSNIIFSFIIPDDIKYYVYTNNSQEHEVLLQRGIRYTIQDNTPTIYTYEIVLSGILHKKTRNVYNVIISKIPENIIPSYIKKLVFRGGKKHKKTYKNKRHNKSTRLNKHRIRK